MCHCLVYDAPTMTTSHLYTRLLFELQLQWQTGLCWCWCWLNIWNGVMWVWTNRKYVSIGSCSNLNVSLLRIRCTMIHTRLLLKYTTMAMIYNSALMLMLIEYMERYRVGFGWTASTLVLVHVWIQLCHCLVYNALWHHRNYTFTCHWNTLQWQWHTTLCWCWLNTLITVYV